MPTRKLPLSSNPEWVALPADFDTPFTPEQEAAFYAPGADRVISRMLIAASQDTAFMARLRSSTRLTQHSTHSTLPSEANGELQANSA